MPFHHNRITSPLALAVVLLAPLSAHAQFPGDVFFAEPSISVPAGETGTLEVHLFSGATPVGATHVDILVDPSLAEIVGVEAGSTSELAAGHVSDTVLGGVSAVNLNGVSLTQPIGTSSLALIEIRPLTAAGTRIPVTIQIRSLLRADSTELPSGQAFSGEILVVNSAARRMSESATKERGSTEGDSATLRERALLFRRPGLAVDLLEFDRAGSRISTTRHRVVIPDSSAPSEASRK